MSGLLLEVKDLSVTVNGHHPVRPVQSIDLSLSPGETLCLVGESGCGKSLTALALMGLLPPSMTRHAATMRLSGENLLTAGAGRLESLRGDRMAMIFQDASTALNPVMTIGEQLTELWDRHRPDASGSARQRAVDLLEMVGISAAASRLRQYPHQLSGGMRQRVGIAMSLMCDPALLIADEPTTALDVTVQAQTLTVLVELCRTFGTGLIFITHDFGVVARIADRVAVMYAGQIVETADAAELFASATHPYTQRLMDSLIVPGRLQPRQRLSAISGTVPAPVWSIDACRFADRCDYTAEICLAGPIAMRGVGHTTRCVRA